MASLFTCHLELVVWDGNLVKYSILLFAFPFKFGLILVKYEINTCSDYSDCSSVNWIEHGGKSYRRHENLPEQTYVVQKLYT